MSKQVVYNQIIRGKDGKLTTPDGKVLRRGNVDRANSDNMDWLPWVMGGSGALLAHSLASAIVDGDGSTKQKESAWERLVKTLIPLGIGAAGAYGGYQLGESLKTAQVTNNVPDYTTVYINGKPRALDPELADRLPELQREQAKADPLEALTGDISDKELGAAWSHWGGKSLMGAGGAGALLAPNIARHWVSKHPKKSLEGLTPEQLQESYLRSEMGVENIRNDIRNNMNMGNPNLLGNQSNLARRIWDKIKDSRIGKFIRVESNPQVRWAKNIRNQRYADAFPEKALTKNIRNVSGLVGLAGLGLDYLGDSKGNDAVKSQLLKKRQQNLDSIFDQL